LLPNVVIWRYPTTVVRFRPVSLIATYSTTEAAAALGVRPVTVCKMIREGRLAAVRIGRSWRIGLSSMNALLAGATGVPSMAGRGAAVVSERRHATLVVPDVAAKATPAVVPEQRNLAASPVQNDPPAPRKPRFSDEDMRWVNRYRIEATDPDPEVRRNALYQLSMFERRAVEDEKWERLRGVVGQLTAEQMRNVI